MRQQAAEEDLEMPVVLEEFGCKLDARPDQYRLAYDSCLTSAKRGGSCAGVMFWDLAHKVTQLPPAWMALQSCPLRIAESHVGCA